MNLARYRFQQVAERFGEFGTLDGLLIGVGRHEYHRSAHLRLQRRSRGYTVHFAPQPDVHQHQVEAGRPRTLQGLFSGGRDHRRGIAQPGDPPRQIGGNQALVFDYQDSFLEIFACFHWGWFSRKV